MNISIENKVENAVLDREEIEFKMEFDGAIPSRDATKSALSAAISIPKDRIVILSISSNYGKKLAMGKAHVYQTAKAAESAKSYLLKRDGMGAKKQEPKEGEKKE